MQNLWESCLRRLEQELPAQQFNTWIRPLAPEFGDGNDTLVLAAPNRFVLELVRERFAARAKRWGEASDKRRRTLADNAKAVAGNTPIDVRWLSYQIGQALQDDWVVFDDTFSSLEDETLERVIDLFTHGVSGTTIIHIGRSTQMHLPLFARVLHLTRRSDAGEKEEWVAERVLRRVR